MNASNSFDNVSLQMAGLVGGNWNFVGKEIFVCVSSCAMAINIIAFVAIYKSRKSFDNNGFWEQILVLCVSDTVLGFGLLLVTLSQFKAFHNSRFGTLSGLAYAICQISSFGNILGVSIQRFISLRKAGERHQTWTRKHTILYCAGNFTVMLVLLAIYVVLLNIIPSTLAKLAFIIEACIVVWVINIFCFLTLYFLNKSLKRVGAMGVQTQVQTAKQGHGAQNCLQVRDDQTICTIVESDNNGKGGSQSKTETVSQVNTASDECSIIGNSEVQFVEKVHDSAPNRLPGTSGEPPSSVFRDAKDASRSVNTTAKRPEPRVQPQPSRNARMSRFGRYQRDAVLTVALIVLLLNLFSLVPATAAIAGRIDLDPDNAELYRALVLTFSFNSLVNPIVYVFRMKFLKARIARTLNQWYTHFRCQCTRS